jgi:hypothetical protein
MRILVIRASRMDVSNRRIAALLPAAAGWIGGMLLAFHPMILSGLRRMQSDWGDTRLNNYILEHGYRWLREMPGNAHLWSPPVFFPAPNTAAYSDVLLGVAPLYWPWRIVGFAPDTAFQLWMLTIGTLNYVAALLLFARGFRCRPVASAVGATLFSFAAIRTAQIIHAQLLPHFYVVLALFALIRLFEHAPERRSIWVAALAAACVAQLYSSYYYAWYLFFAMLLAAIGAAAFPNSRARALATIRTNLWPLGVCACVAGLLLAPLVIHYSQAVHEVGMRNFSAIEPMLPRPESWAYMGPGSWLYGGLDRFALFHEIPMEHEQRLGLGIGTAVFAAMGLWTARRRRLVRFAALVPLAMAVVATRWPGGFTLWRAVFALVPGAAALRAISRIGIAVVLAASLGVALLVDFLSSARAGARPPTAPPMAARNRWLHALAIVLIAAVVFLEQGQRLPSYDKLAGRARVARITGELGSRCAAFLYTTVGGADDPWHYHADAMWASMERATPTLNGYSGNQPPGWPFYDIRVQSAKQDSAISDSVSAWAARWHMDSRSICRVRVPVD